MSLRFGELSLGLYRGRVDFLLQAEMTCVSSLVPSFSVAGAFPAVTMRRVLLLLKACIFLFFRKDTYQTPGACGKTTRMFIFRKHLQGHFVLRLTTSFLYTVFPMAGSGVLTAQCLLHTPCCKDAAVGSWERDGGYLVCGPGEGVPRMFPP